MNNKGWIRIAEAFIAIVLIASALAFIYTSKTTTNENDIVKIENALLDEISQDDNFRTAIFNNNSQGIEQFISERAPKVLDFKFLICEISDECMIDVQGSVYARERIISSTLQDYSPKRIKLFMWEK